MAYTPSVQDLADIVKRFYAAGQSRLAEMYPPAQTPPPLPSTDPLSQSGVPFTNQLPQGYDQVPPMPGGAPFVPTPGGVGKFNPATGVTTPITPGGRMAPGPETIPPVLPTPGAQTTFGFPTQPGSPLQSGSAYVPASSGYASGLPTAGGGRLSDTVAPPVAGQQQLDPGMGRTADLSLPPGFLDAYNDAQRRTRGAIGALALQSGVFPGLPTSLGSAFTQAAPQQDQPAPPLLPQPLVGAPLSLSRRLS
jgi:hypothetical protein